ncbi:zinc finger SWIM domain-containing protein 3-like [Cotesia typhae]|uniref:zinc finger SWIM domain-containing protein 3-like n=1 Tax=Cotesia typhae TaxID=2053667 RepID=UPI003D69D3B1
MADDQASKKDEMYPGKKFDSYKDLQSFIVDYQQQMKTVLVTRDSGLLHTNEEISQEIVEKFVYHKIKFYCKFANRNKPSKATERTTSTVQLHCLFRIHIKLINYQYLEVISCNLEHENHSESEEFFNFIPEIRRLNSTEMKEVIKYLELDANKKKIQHMIEREYGKHVTLKQLHNINTMRKANIDNSGVLLPIIEKLRTEYKANVSVYHTQDGKCKGIYFSTEEMHRDFASWPSIVMIDGTYKLNDRNLTLMLLVVQDSKGRGQVVGFGLLGSEDKDTLKWMIQSFKTENEPHCSKIESFMSDKDLTERYVLQELFPNTPIYICRFHVLKTFKKVVKSTEMNLRKNKQKKTLTILEKLCYTKSDIQYYKLYEQLKETSSYQLLDYYNVNWHNIKEEWTAHHMAKHNIGNTSNNRVESLNAKIKQVVKKNSSVLVMIDDLF